jgi:hypothetical protein
MVEISEYGSEGAPGGQLPGATRLRDAHGIRVILARSARRPFADMLKASVPRSPSEKIEQTAKAPRSPREAEPSRGEGIPGASGSEPLGPDARARWTHAERGCSWAARSRNARPRSACDQVRGRPNRRHCPASARLENVQHSGTSGAARPRFVRGGRNDDARRRRGGRDGARTGTRRFVKGRFWIHTACVRDAPGCTRALPPWRKPGGCRWA